MWQKMKKRILKKFGHVALRPTILIEKCCLRDTIKFLKRACTKDPFESAIWSSGLNWFALGPSIHYVRKRSGWVQKMTVFAYVHYCIYADIVGGWVRKGPKMCWRYIWMVSLLLNDVGYDKAFRESILHVASKLDF